MRSPEITAFTKGKLEWTVDEAGSFFVLKINGKIVSDGDDGLYKKNYFSLADIKTDAVIEICSAKRKNAVTPLKYDAKSKTLRFLPIRARAKGETLCWNAVGGASCYKVYDTDFNAVTVCGTEYDMYGKNIAACVCPVAAQGVGVLPAEPTSGGITYLDGDGTEENPFAIKKPFDLRAVDYYELCYAEHGGNINHYLLSGDIDFGEVVSPDGESNIYTLKKPFFGTLDGGGHRLYGIRVHFDGGYRAAFDYIAECGTVKNIIIENADMVNRTQNAKHPINASTAAVAYVNNGVIQNVTLRGVRLTSCGGGVAGIAIHNGGTVSGCKVDCTLVQESTAEMGGASYEMAGVVLENKRGGIVSHNTVYSLNIRGASANVRSAAGVVSVNRAGGAVIRNEFIGVTVSGAVRDSEYGGIVAYNAGDMKDNIAAGTLIVDDAYITEPADGRGKLVGKNDGTTVGEEA